MKAAVLIEYDEPRVSQTLSAVLGAVQQAKQNHNYDRVCAMVLGGADAQPMAQCVAQYPVDEVIYVSSPHLSQYLADTYSRAIEQLIEELGFEVCLFPCSSLGKDCAPRVAASLEAGQASDVLEFVPGGSFKRLMYAGNVVAEVEILTSRKVITIRSSAFEPAVPSNVLAPIREISLQLDASSSQTIIGMQGSSSDRPQLGEASVVVSGGRGIQSTEQFESILFPLADVLNAAVGASRAAVDSGFAPNDWQVGQTGKVVAPDLYIAVGISGAIQHLAGMKESKCIVAINSDPEAPIFDVADYGLEEDLFTAVPKLVELLSKHCKR